MQATIFDLALWQEMQEILGAIWGLANNNKLDS